MSTIGGSTSSNLSKNIIKSIHELRKPTASQYQVAGLAYGGDYYNATQAIHKSLTEAVELRCYFTILYYDTKMKESGEYINTWSGMDRSIEQLLNYRFDVRNL